MCPTFNLPPILLLVLLAAAASLAILLLTKRLHCAAGILVKTYFLDKVSPRPLHPPASRRTEATLPLSPPPNPQRIYFIYPEEMTLHTKITSSYCSHSPPPPLHRIRAVPALLRTAALHGSESWAGRPVDVQNK